MAETVTVPGMGSVKKQYVLAGGGIVAGIVGFAWWRRSNVGGGAADIPVYDTSQLVPGTDYTNPGSNSNIPPQDQTGDTITTNAEWTQQATTYLGNIGYEPRLVAAALGIYFQRSEPDPDQMSAVMAAIAAFGPPPQNGPWPLRPKGPPITTQPVPPPPPAGPTQLGPVRNLRVTGRTASTVSLAWDPVPGATAYLVRLNGKAGGWPAAWDGTPTNSYTVGGLRFPNTTYIFYVNAERGEDNGPQTRIDVSTTG